MSGIGLGFSELRRGAPLVEMRRLETVWLQVGGTICNLRCRHCFISCAPDNDKFKFMSLERCREFLAEANELGVSDFYFTGGEPFANPQIGEILEAALQHGPATVLTNATLFREPVLSRLSCLRDAAEHPLEIRVSLDGYSAEMNDAIRGQGSFERAMKGVADLVRCGFTPIITMAKTWCGCDDEPLAAFRQVLSQVGYESPRLKILPLLKLGAESDRTGGYCENTRVTYDMMTGFDSSNLLCSTARTATEQGVWVCPILLDSTEARMGPTLGEALVAYPLRHAACYTCYNFGAICSNSTGCDR